ncbi:Fur family transcriptional regulator [Fusibacter tunisiensis]|jgi:Fe2+ or Zn2+ uptake regulation protein|uniref:Fe2+ or Zn2+ uptake regulation protein n=1 Tax=Fusibacter tunisiensis TaxID=1008308 RepID=A0ABS2MN21_9FIRM|nr:Fur family transcriptional regulator [Fusibacter tunisiensis]MBM7560799.1 Fe2+ or Zn2+ uptake regulation protein [Fusibacter tunisiensis]
MNQKVIDIENILKSRGYKLTESRKKMVELFVKTDVHLKPDDAYQILRKEGVSLPTVYRNIDMLREMGIIKEITLENDRYYELDLFSGKKMHIHFKCHKCGIIKEYDSSEVKRMMLEQRDFLEKTYGDYIEDVSIVMQGICETCRQLKSQS